MKREIHLEELKKILEEVTSSNRTSDGILDALQQKGMKITKEKLDEVLQTFFLKLGGMWFSLEKKTVYLYISAGSPGIGERVKRNIWKTHVDEGLVLFYQNNPDKILVLDDEIKKALDEVSSPKKEKLLTELSSITD